MLSLSVEMPKRIAVIGLGNSLRRDDGIGVIILKALRDSGKKEGIDYLDFGTFSFDLLHRFSNYKAVLLIDAVNASLPAGKVKIFKLSEIEDNFKRPVSSSHELDLKDLSGLCKKIGIKTQVYVAGIQVKDVSYAEGLSSALKRAQARIIKEIAAFIGTNFNREF